MALGTLSFLLFTLSGQIKSKGRIRLAGESDNDLARADSRKWKLCRAQEKQLDKQTTNTGKFHLKHQSALSFQIGAKVTMKNYGNLILFSLGSFTLKRRKKSKARR